KITLKGIKPAIWRRIQVPETYTFWDLHIAIQDAMGWADSHLHLFTVVDPSTGMKIETGIPTGELDEYDEILPGWGQKIADYFVMENRTASYVYDFGDAWEHKIHLEKIFAKEKNILYPRCTKGQRACPPEDCGGVYGYGDLLEILRDPEHEEYEELKEWVGGEFDPEHFDLEEVGFDDPVERRKKLIR
ncbi:MAG: plasmid pRiA4b ORF-3 family protein, partial [Methanophagales archaeon]|nr:plasmid pRiA4b ORF-3 family protein [Methanophagales archaeon]